MRGGKSWAGKTSLSDLYHRLAARGGKKWAMVAVAHAVDVIRDRASPKDTNLRLRLTDIPVVTMKDVEEGRHPRSRLHRMWDALNLSFSVYTKLGTGRRVARKWSGVVIREWILGLFMVAVFFYTLTNTVPLGQRLLSTGL
jgi:hypothetical protein